MELGSGLVDLTGESPFLPLTLVPKKLPISTRTNRESSIARQDPSRLVPHRNHGHEVPRLAPAPR